MKELQNFVYRHMDALRHHKRYLAMLTALSMLVTFIVPLILIEPADSMSGILICGKTEHIHDDSCYEDDTLICGQELHTHSEACYLKYSSKALKGTENDINGENINVENYYGDEGNDGWSPKEVRLYTLLFGEGENHWVKPGATLDDNLLIANQEYFLGFASDFCAFIESDFEAYDADAEGRVFIGGDLMFYGNPQVGEWNYQVGAGDYGHFTPISQTDEYFGISGFASGIIGGKVYRLGTMTTGSTVTVGEGYNLPLPDGKCLRHTSGYDIFVYPEEGAYKRFIVGNMEDSRHLDEDYLTHGDGETKDVPYSDSCNHLYADVGCAFCGTNTDHDYLGHVNELAQFYKYNEVNKLLEKTFDTLRARSLSLASVDSISAVYDKNNDLVLDATNIGDAKTVYFKIDEWKNFNNVIIKVPDDRITFTEDGDKEISFTQNNKTIKNLDLNIIISCDDDEIKIEHSIGTYIVAKDNVETPDDSKGYKISNRNANSTNNHPVSSNILYNFYNASKVEFTGASNFNGTIMAPNADVTSPERCQGHLSGALIARHFHGGLEFGYRPYRGGTDIFGMASGYAVPVDKVDQDGNPLPGALFAIKENAKFVSLFESGKNTNFAALPSRVDFTGNTLFQRESISQSDADRVYNGEMEDGGKITAPVGFKLYKEYDYNNSNLSQEISVGQENTGLGNTVKFYLKADPLQDVVIDSNENIYVEGPDQNNVYTIHLIKPVKDSFDITVRNAADTDSKKTATIKVAQNMSLGVTGENDIYQINNKLTLSLSDPPVDDNTICYQYYVNGNVIKVNNSDYTTDTSFDYTPTSPGNMTYSVKAFVVVNNTYYEVAQAEKKVEIKDANLDEVSIAVTDSNGNDVTEVTSGEKISIKVNRGYEWPANSTVEYYFNNVLVGSGTDKFSCEVDTAKFAGKDVPLKVIISYTDENNQLISAERYDTITVNFTDDDNISFNDYYEEYIIDPNSNLYFSLNNNSTYYNNFNSQTSITYYFDGQPIANNGNSIAKTLVKNNIPVYAILTVNGLDKKVEGKSVTGKYGGTLNLGNGPYISDSNIKLELTNAVNNAQVVFKVYDSNNNLQLESSSQIVTNNTCSVMFTPTKADYFTVRAYIQYGNNSQLEVANSGITVDAATLAGEITVEPSQVLNGANVTFRVYGATEGSNVSFEIKDQRDVTVNSYQIYEPIGASGEYIMSYKPPQAGNYTVYVTFSKNGASSRIRQASFEVNENTSTYTGDFSIIGIDDNKIVTGNMLTFKMESNAIGAEVQFSITGPGLEQPITQNGNINSEGVYSFDYNNVQDLNDGVFTVTGAFVIKGVPTVIKTDTFQKGNVASYTGDIIFENNHEIDGIIANYPFNVKLKTGAPNDTEVVFKFYHYGTYLGQWMEDPIAKVQDGEASTSFTAASVGKYSVKAYINGVFVAEKDFYAQATFKFQDTGQTVRVTTYKYDVEERIKEIQAVTINGVEADNITNDNGYLIFNQPTESGTIYIRVMLNGGAIAECTRSFVVNNDNFEIVSTVQNTLSLRKSLRILESEENTEPTEPVVSEVFNFAPNKGEIDSVRLTFPDAITSDFEIEATFKKSNGDPETTKYTKDSLGDHPMYLDVVCPENTIEIQFKAITGSVTVDKCYPKYEVVENKVTKEVPRSFTLNQNEEKVIVIDDWTINNGTVQVLDSLSFELASDGKIYYALVSKDQTEIPVFNEVQSSDNKIEISGLGAENIEKIKIYTTEDTLTVNKYTIGAFIGNDKYEDQIKLEENLNDEFDVINYYTLVEQQGPVGYYKENTIYNIEVKESINLAKLSYGVPTAILTTVTVKDLTGNTVMKYTVDITESKDGSTTERIVIVDGVTFTIIKTDETITVTSSDNTIDTSKWDTTKSKQYGKYYFDPVAMTVVPVPTPIKYTNEMGLLFRKVDDNGALVKGVTIKLYKINGATEEEVGSDLWNWDENTSERLVDYTKLDENTVYMFRETKRDEKKYEQADDIYFQKTTGEKKITYWTGSSTMPTEADKKTVLDLTDYRVIKMVDVRVLGIKLSLDKFYKDNVETPENPGTSDAPEKDLEGAKFSLYSNDGVLICSDLDGNGNIFDNEVFKKLDNIYVENGYLKPGMYFLTEDVVPMHPTNEETGFTFENPGKMYFTIESDFSIKPGKPSGGTYNLGEIEKHENGQKVFITKKDKTVMNGSEAAAINDVVEFVITGTFNDIYLNNIDIKGINKSGDTYTHTFATPYKLTKFELQRWGGNGVTITSLRIKDKNDNVYQYPIGDEIPPTYTEPTGVLSINGATLKVENKVDDGFIDIPVSKKWVGDVNFEELRSEIEVKLYRTTTPKVHSELTDEDVYKIVQGEGEQTTETEAKVTLNDANKWSHVFEKLPSFYFKDGDTKRYPYYYYIKETTVPNGYEASYSTNGDGTLVVTNTLQTVNINAQKSWDVSSLPSYENMIPDSIVLKVQWSKDNGKTWKDISSKTITVKRADDFKGVFKNLPKGYKYRIAEAYSPNGWYVSVPSTETEVNDNNTTFTITNAPKLGSFTIQKDWLNDSNSSRPKNINIQLRRAIRKLWPEGQPFESVVDEYGNITEVGVSDDYARLLQYSLYFYDGNMCGDQVDENTAYTWRKDCHTTRDTTGDGEYTGGFHDAGDHVMFGLPAGYTASMLGWSMYEFPEAFEELNQTAHMKTIEDYYCDFFMKCAKFDDDGNITAILYQKGNGTPDHAYWGMPEKQDEVMETEAGTELYWTDDAELNGAKVGGDIASEYAAALAIAYLNYQKTYKYYDDGAQKYDNYLKMAKKLFAFALENRGCVYGQNIEYVDGKETGGYYKSTSNYDDLGLAAVWLHIATRENETATTEYKTYLEGKTDNTNHMPSYGGLNISWNDVGSAAAIAYALHVDSTRQQGIINSINSSITNEVKDAQGNVTQRTAKTEYMFGDNSGGWGQMRHNAAYQTAVLIANKFNDTDTNAEWAKWCKTQMDVILGNNTSSGNDGRHIRTSTCYVTNFAENTLLHPHYRATSGMGVEMVAKNDPAVINGYDIDPYKLIGGLAGGWKNNGQDGFVDERLNYEETEVATDYNAGLVCAAAGLYDFYGTGHTYEIPGVKTQYLQLDPAIEAPEMMYVGDSINLNITGFDDVPNITWEIITENGEEPKAEIANDGKLTAKETGLVKVRVSGDTATGVTRSATAEIMVYEQASISVPNGTVEENGTYIMEANTEMQLTAENFEQDAEIEWSVTNTDGNSTYVASIDDNGKLTANDAGTVIVKAESQYKRATIMVKVNAPAVDAQADSAPISNSSDQISVNTSDTDAVMSRLMSYAIRQTSVKVLADENKIVFNSTTNSGYFNDIKGNGANVESLLFGKNITKIEVSLTAQDACFRLNGQRFLNNANIPGVGASWNGNTLILIAQEENGVKKFKALWDSDVQNDSITSIKCEQWGGSLNSVTVYYKIEGISITNTEKEIVEGDTITLNSSGATGDVTWVLPDNTTEVEGTSYNYTAPDVNADTVVTFKAKDSGNTSKIPELTLTIKPLVITGQSEMNIQESTLQTLDLNSERENSSFTWDSSDDSVVTVGENTGVVTALKVGEAIITATDTSGITASFKIAVNDVKPLEVSVEKNTININEPLTIITNSDDVVFEGYDNSVIKIENNTITGLKGGSTTITARRTSDNATKQISITVNGMSINTNGGSTSVDVGSELDISSWSINYQPYGHSQYVWSSADTQYATYSNGKVTGVKSGTVNIIVQSVDSSGNVLATATQQITVNKGSVVETPDGYELIHKQNENDKNLVGYTVFSSNPDDKAPAVPDELNGKTVDYIIVQFSHDENQYSDFNGAFYYNGNQIKFHSKDGSGDWNLIEDGLLYIPIESGVEITSAKFDCWNNGMNAKVKNIYFYSKIPEPEITTPEGTTYDGEYVVMYKGDTLNLTAKNFNGNVSWSASTGDVTVTGNGTTAEITADNITNENGVVIRATAGEETASIKVKVLPQPLIVDLSPSEIRAGSESAITVTAKGEEINEVEFTISPEGTGITIENNVIKVPADYSGESEVTITASKDGYASGESKLKIKPGLVVSPNGNIVMNVGDIKKFSAYNAIGNVTWENLTPEILSVDEKGNVTAIMFGQGQIKVRDEGSGEPIVIDITVQQVGVTVKLPENSEIVGNYTLTSDDLVNGSWQKAIENLPYVNEYGDEYYYYIVETDANGNPVTAVTGNGVSYIPIYYTNNGLTLNDVNEKALSVGNAATEKPQGTLPSTGGSGVTTYYYLGGVIMLLSIAGFTSLKRRERKRRKE